MCGLKKIEAERYHGYTDYARAVPYGRVYPLSVCEGRQSGDIYTDGRAVLFWHRCGFAAVGGEVSENFIYEVKKLMQDSERRLVLFADDEIAEHFGEGYAKARRLFFEYPEGKAVKQYPLPEGYEMSLLMPWLIPQLTGRIVPAFSWENDRQFLDHGTGFCVTHEDRPCAWAFTAAVGGDEVDIGVETAENYRRKGLACAAAAMTAAAVKEHGKKPVWACHEGNTGSAGLAQKLGFIKTNECFVIHTA